MTAPNPFQAPTPKSFDREGTPSGRRRAWPCLAAAAVAFAAAAPAEAHKSSDAYLVWTDRGTHIEQRLDLALRDLDRELVLDADGDHALRWGEVRARWSEIEQLARDGVHLWAGGQPCEARAHAGPPQLEQHSDGRYAVVRLTWSCLTPGPLTVQYRLFAQSDATHRGIARWDHAPERDAGSNLQVLVPSDAPQPMVIAPASRRDGVVPLRDGRAGFLGFVGKGLQHIAAGLDHLLFLATLLMVAVWRRDGSGWVPREGAASAWREAVRLVTAFTVAHSVTLGLAASGLLAPPSRWIESLIAISVLVAALDNLRPFVPGPRWAMVAVFGLVHGFGFAGPLQDLGLRGGELVWPLLGFNLGVELGQLAVVAVLLPLAIAWRRRGPYRAWVVRPCSVAVAVLALAWSMERALDLRLLG